jgi:hypothetical protein
MSNTSNETHGYQADIECGVRDVPAMDLDFILAEYDRCVPMALIDYKHEHGAINFQSANIRTLTLSATWQATSVHRPLRSLQPRRLVGRSTRRLNTMVPSDTAQQSRAHGAGLPSNDNNTKLSELVFVTWLYELRGRKIPQDIVDTLNK